MTIEGLPVFTGVYKLNSFQKPFIIKEGEFGIASAIMNILKSRQEYLIDRIPPKIPIYYTSISDNKILQVGDAASLRNTPEKKPEEYLMTFIAQSDKNRIRPNLKEIGWEIKEGQELVMVGKLDFFHIYSADLYGKI